MTSIKPGIYRHYKGGLYKVLGTGRIEKDLSEVVIYESLHDSPDFRKGTLWVRPIKNFTEIVKKDGKEIPRFSFEKNF